MSCVEHTRCLDWNTRNFLRGTQEMFCLEHRNCRVWNRGIVLRGAEEMSCLEHIKCSAWDTGNVVHGHRNSIPWWHHPSITLQVLILNFENELSQLACSFSTFSPSTQGVRKASGHGHENHECCDDGYGKDTFLGAGQNRA